MDKSFRMPLALATSVKDCQLLFVASVALDATEATYGSFRTPLTGVALADDVQKLLLRFCSHWQRRPVAAYSSQLYNISL